MKKLFKIFGVLSLLFVTTAPLAQSTNIFWYPYKPHLPKMVITWGGNSCGHPPAQLINDDSSADALCSQFTSADTRWCSFLGINYKCCINGDSGKQSWGASYIKSRLEALCRLHYRAIRSQMKSECDYIVAYKVGLDFTAIGSQDTEYAMKKCFFNDDVGGPLSASWGVQNSSTGQWTPPSSGWRDPIGPGSCGTSAATSSCSGSHNVGAPTVCTNNIFGVKFVLKRNEAGCLAHQSSASSSSRKCPACYEDRDRHYDSSFDKSSGSPGAPSNLIRNPLDPRDDNGNTPSAGEIEDAGGPIMSQGCMPQSSNTVMGSVGSNSGGLNLSSVFNLATNMNFSSLINIMAPGCAFFPDANETTYMKFENWGTDDAKQCDANSKQCNEVYKPIDQTYDAIVNAGTNRTNPYKGNCGRGKFFYKNLTAHDANVNTPVPFFADKTNPEWQALKEDTNDIWLSRTGCYNPEERFVIFPAGRVTEEIKFFMPTAQLLDLTQVAPWVATAAMANFNALNNNSSSSGGGVSAILSDYAKTYARMQVRSLETLAGRDDLSDPWDEPEDWCDNGGGGSGSGSGTGCGQVGQFGYAPDGKLDQIDTSVPATHLIPNDRLLMRHPMCISTYNSALYSLGGASSSGGFNLNASANKALAIRQAISQSELNRGMITKYGALPVCLADDSLDEVDAFCSHYVEKTYEPPEVYGYNVPVQLNTYYTTDKYVFNYNNFCWEKSNINYFTAFDPAEHWMPLALKLDPSANELTGSVTNTDIYGNQQVYMKTDFRRNHLTDYAARVVKDNGPDTNHDSIPEYHDYYSLEEYGYRDLPFPKEDYVFNVLNIYRPNAATPLKSSEIYSQMNVGRKAKMQRCLKTYLEQWAFEGDKGAIVLDTYQKLLSEGANQVTPDASMCQWVAYYDTSDNYGKEEMFDFSSLSSMSSFNLTDLQNMFGKERNLFKATMYYYFAQVQNKNKEYRDSLAGDREKYNLGFVLEDQGMDATLFHLPPPIFTVFTSWQAPGSFPGMDPERLQSQHVRGEFPGSNIMPNGVPPNLLGAIAKENLSSMNDYGFRRPRGLRPEYWDYMNFLSYSAMGVMEEGLDLTNGTTVGDGNALGDEFATLNAATSATLGNDTAIQKILNENLYTPRVDPSILSSSGNFSSVMSNITQSIGWQVNMERRGCNTVVPPHFWRDTIRPFKMGTRGEPSREAINKPGDSFAPGASEIGECDFNRGAEVVNDLRVALSEKPAGNLVASVLDLFLDDIFGFFKIDNTHWMTTNTSTPMLSLITVVPTLPVLAYGFNYDNNYFYIKTGFSKYQLPVVKKKMPIYIQDSWLARSGGKPVMGEHPIEPKWQGTNAGNWFGNEENQDGGQDGIPDDDDGLHQLYDFYGEDYIGSWKELGRQVEKNAKKGLIIWNEEDLSTASSDIPSSREWVEHIWPGSTCMHMMENDAIPDLVNYFMGDPTIPQDGLVYKVAGTSASITSPPNTDLPSEVVVRDGRKYIALKEGDEGFKYINDAFDVKDDIYLGEIPLFNAPYKSSSSSGSSSGSGSGGSSSSSGSSIPPYKDNKQMGGFNVFNGQSTRFFEWMPHAWSLAIGINKAFWCEFELPYNPFFTGDENFKFNKKPVAAHFNVNAVKVDLTQFRFEEGKIPANSKPKLEYYRVERIRDACGPFGVRSTWIDDPNSLLGKWLIGTADSYYTRSINLIAGGSLPTANKSADLKTRSRCSGWLDMYRKGVTDPKIIAWRLPRFDYEFMKSFLECTGPITPPKNPCSLNQDQLDLNNANALCEAGMAVTNLVMCILFDVFQEYTGPCDDYEAVECYLGGGAGTFDVDIGGVFTLQINMGQTASDNGSTGSCTTKNCQMNDGDGDNFKMMDKAIDDALRALDYASRGDTFYGMEEQVEGDEEGSSGGGTSSGMYSSGGASGGFNTSSGAASGAGGGSSGSGAGSSSGSTAQSSSLDSICDGLNNSLTNLSTYAQQANQQCTPFSQAANSISNQLTASQSQINNLPNLSQTFSNSYQNAMGQFGVQAQALALCADPNINGTNSVFSQMQNLANTINTPIQSGITTINNYTQVYTSMTNTSSLVSQAVNSTGMPNPPASQLQSQVSNLINSNNLNPTQTALTQINTGINNVTSLNGQINGQVSLIGSYCQQLINGTSSDPTQSAQIIVNAAGQFQGVQQQLSTAISSIQTAMGTVNNICSSISNVSNSITTIQSTVSTACNVGGALQSIGSIAGGMNNLMSASSGGGWDNNSLSNAGSGSGAGASGGGGSAPSSGNQGSNDKRNYQDPKYALEGFIDHDDNKRHSTQIDQFWLRDPNNPNNFITEGRPFGFWCNCPADDPRTTRCREDLCTTEQHVLLVGRNVDGAVDIASKVGLDMTWLQDLLTPVAITKAPGPFGRWLQCYYQARAKACPVLTREVSDTPTYSTAVDPFPKDRTLTTGLTEASSRGQNFNVCAVTNPTGIGDKDMDQFMRWMKEEPNHLARLPVWFESSGAGYRHQDLLFYTQVRDIEAPYMEMAVPFPIDLITRDCQLDPATGKCQNTERPEENEKPFTNLLGEINQREGTTSINYYNRGSIDTNTDGYASFTAQNGGTPHTASKTDEYDAKEFYKDGFQSRLLLKHDTTKIEPSQPAGDLTQYTDSLAYTDLYTKYLKGLYAVAKSYKHDDKAAEPLDPAPVGMKGSSVPSNDLGLIDDTDTGDRYEKEDERQINPRAQETIVGPRGCDIGGWYEMMLYQARCIRFFRLNCICDYDKTFAGGNDINFALKSSGMSFQVSYQGLEGVVPKIEIPKSKTKDVIINLQPGQKRTPAGQVKPSIGGHLEQGVQAVTNLFKSSVEAYNIGVVGVPKDFKGRDMIESFGNIAIRDDFNIPFPLAPRGIVGPEFAFNSSGTSSSGFGAASSSGSASSSGGVGGQVFKLTGLSNVKVGDLIYWDETIYANLNGNMVDAGYPRHIAVVTEVERARGKDSSSSSSGGAGSSGGSSSGSGMITTNIVNPPLNIKVREMNWGKNYDSCGNTDMWGKESERTIWNPGVEPKLDLMSQITSTSTINGIPVLYTNQPKKASKKYASCQNADWAVCAEKYWDQVKIYRPYVVPLKAGADGKYAGYDEPLADPVYQRSWCDPNGQFFPKLLTTDRLLQVASDEGILTDSGITIPSNADSDLKAKKLQEIRVWLTAKVQEDAFNSSSAYNLNKVLYESGKWKIFAKNPRSYPVDEVEAFLNNPLYGAVDKCDPPVRLRDNFEDVLRDTINAHTKD